MSDLPPVILNDDFQHVLDELEKGTSMFITGRAGTGKSTLLKLFKKTTRKKVVVLAPTGIAALHIQGQTIHSFFGFPPKTLTRDQIKSKPYKKIYQKPDAFIIDEISMVRADLIDHIDQFLRINGRDENLPFGGAQMIFFGDLFQLPPVVRQDEMLFFKTQYQTPYFFSAEVFDEFELEGLELREVFRQKNRGFVNLLDAIRTNSLDYDDLEALNERYIEDTEELTLHTDFITLSARNDTVNKINSSRLEALDEVSHQFVATVSGNFKENLFPTAPILQLKKGAQVMFIKNDVNKKYVNGTLGKVIDLDREKLKVKVIRDDGTEDILKIKPASWEMIRHKIDLKGELITDTIGTFKQYPVRLAWAITIHKSQGKTFENVIIDLGKGAFAHGQTYVALSRCTSLEGIILKKRIHPRDIMLDPTVIEYYDSHF